MAVTVTENPEIWSDSLFLLVLLRFTTCFTTFYNFFTTFTTFYYVFTPFRMFSNFFMFWDVFEG